MQGPCYWSQPGFRIEESDIDPGIPAPSSKIKGKEQAHAPGHNMSLIEVLQIDPMKPALIMRLTCVLKRKPSLYNVPLNVNLIV